MKRIIYVQCRCVFLISYISHYSCSICVCISVLKSQHRDVKDLRVCQPYIYTCMISYMFNVYVFLTRYVSFYSCSIYVCVYTCSIVV